MRYAHGFVVDGWERAYAALEPQIRAEVTAGYAACLEQANFWQRVALFREIKREVERRIELQAPRDALY